MKTVNTPGMRQLLAMSIPVIIANSATPMLGLVDTAVLGQTGNTTDLGAIALGTLVFNFLFWGVNFLRMSTSGFVAQAHGAQDEEEQAAILFRGLSLALLISFAFLVLQIPICREALAILGGSQAVERSVETYFLIRIWGAPASFALLIWMGTLIGRGETRTLLWLQLLLNGSNIVLDVLFAGVMGWGIAGIAIGTVIANWLTSLIAAFIVLKRVIPKRALTLARWQTAITDRTKRTQLLTANGDIFIRTLFLVGSFAVFTDQSARFGDTILAANHILLQLTTFSAFFLDGYANVTESVAGQAWGARQPTLFREVVKRTTLLAAITALALGLTFWGLQSWILPLLTRSVSVQQMASVLMPFAAGYIVLSFAAFQLDGIFIGCTQTRALRNASIGSASVFFLLCVLWVGPYKHVGLWMAMLVFVVSRAIALSLYYPSLLRQLQAEPEKTSHQA